MMRMLRCSTFAAGGTMPWRNQMGLRALAAPRPDEAILATLNH
jgi:hypothetical protein